MQKLIVIQHLARESAGLFSKIAFKKGMDVSIIRVDQGEHIPTPTKNDLFLIMGGPMGISDIHNPLYPWFKNEINLIIDCLNKKIGLIGICLGAQLLAYTAGGNIQPLKAGNPIRDFPEIGWGNIFSVNKNPDEKIMSYFNSPLEVLHWHGDRIILPNQAKLLASSERCKEQFFRIGNMAYGLQCHIEIENSMIKKWIIEDNEFLTKGLGLQGQKIVSTQQQALRASNRSDRIKLINGLLNLLIVK